MLDMVMLDDGRASATTDFGIQNGIIKNLRPCPRRSLYGLNRISRAMVMLDDSGDIATAEFGVSNRKLMKIAFVPSVLALGFELNIACDEYVG